VKDVASALSDLILATKNASGKSSHDPTMTGLKDTAKVWIDLLSTHADRQGVDISFTVCFLCVCVCLFVRFRIFPARIKLVVSNFVWWFIGVLGRESPILGNFAPPEAQNWTNRPPRKQRMFTVLVEYIYSDILFSEHAGQTLR